MYKHNIKPFGKFSYASSLIDIYNFDSSDIFLRVGNFTSIADGVKVFLDQGNHYSESCTTYPFWKNFNTGELYKSRTYGDVVIGNDVWIGSKVTIMSGITIGDGAIVAANSHVIKDVEPYSIYGGNPAKLIKYRFDKDIIDRFLKIQWWNYSDSNLKKILSLLQQTPNHDLLDKIQNPELLEEDPYISRYYDIQLAYNDFLYRPCYKPEIEYYMDKALNTSIDEIRSKLSQMRNK